MNSTADILQKALDLTSGDRAKQHGDKFENHRNIANLWSAYLDKHITPAQVCMMMSLMKIARTKTGTHNPDDYVDGAAYLGIGYEVRADLSGDPGIVSLDDRKKS